MSGLGQRIQRVLLVLVMAAMSVTALSILALFAGEIFGLRLPPGPVFLGAGALMLYELAQSRPVPPRTPEAPSPRPRTTWEDVQRAADLEARGRITHEEFEEVLASVLPPRAPRGPRTRGQR